MSETVRKLKEWAESTDPDASKNIENNPGYSRSTEPDYRSKLKSESPDSSSDESYINNRPREAPLNKEFREALMQEHNNIRRKRNH